MVVSWVGRVLHVSGENVGRLLVLVVMVWCGSGGGGVGNWDTMFFYASKTLEGCQDSGVRGGGWSMGYLSTWVRIGFSWAGNITNGGSLWSVLGETPRMDCTEKVGLGIAR